MIVNKLAEFIDLNRTFSDLKRQDASDDSALVRLFGEGHVLRWPALLKEFRVVVLSEAGTGKTTEIRQAARRLRAEGRSAFFIRIEHVIDDLEDAFEEGSFAEFTAWAQSGAEGWLLLDSIDEARLREPRDFEKAIRKLARHLKPVIARTHILITGRTSAWRPATDLALCAKQFPFAPRPPDQAEDADESVGPETVTNGSVANPEVFRVLSLDDFGAPQIRAFLEGKRLEDADDLMKALERQDAWSSAARPQDLEELIDFWREQKRIGSRLELMRNSIDRRLAERDQDRADARPLAAARARVGARIVALAATMAQQSAIRVPDGVQGGAGLPIKNILPDWDDRECATLLDRPIFDNGIYGTVRFHHRSVREFLTAEWLHARLVDEGSRRQIEALFFRQQYGLEVIVPSMRPILPWLVLMDQRILDKVMRLAPEVLFEGGDPSQLPREVRAHILQQTCEQLLQPGHGRSMMDYAAVQRFTAEDLTADIVALLKQHGGNEDIAWLLLRLTGQGELRGAAAEVKTFALESRAYYPRLAALDALRVIGSAPDQAEVRAGILAETGELPRGWLGALIEGVPRRADQVPWIISLLGRVAQNQRFHVDELAQCLYGLFDELPAAALPPLLDGLRDLLGRPPLIDRHYCEISERFGWLDQAAGQVVARLIKDRNSAALGPSALWVLRSLPLASEFGDIEYKPLRDDLAELVQGWPDLNHALFWNSVTEERAAALNDNPSRPLTDYRMVSIFGSFSRFGEADFGRTLADLRDRPNIDDRLIALSLAYTLYVFQGRPAKLRRQIKAEVNSDATLSAQLDQFLNPPARGASPYRSQAARWKRQQARREAERAEKAQDWRGHLAGNLALLRAPTDPKTAPQALHCLNYLQGRLRQDGKRSDRWSEGRWESLVDEFGEDIARAFRDGTVRFWRTYRPDLRSEGAPANSTPFSVILGLTGLSIEARENPNWAEHLSPAEAELACRYALHELNGFPSWLPSLNAATPAVVERVILQEITWEIAREIRESGSLYVLYDVAWSGQWIWNQLASSFVRMLGRPPKNSENLRYMMRVIQGSDFSDSDLAKLAARKAGAARQLVPAAAWFAVWAGVDSVAAVPALTARVAQIRSKLAQTDFMISFANSLLGGRAAAGARGAYRSVEHLRAIYLLIHAYVRQAEDIDRVGDGVYSPGPRDDAQDAREALFGMLQETPGKAAYLALMEISLAHPAAGMRPWMAFHAKAKAAQDADADAWSLQQVQDFYEKLERTPANHRDLWTLAVDRLDNLKADLEDGDSSIAGILKGVVAETDMRKYIGNWCRERAASRYIIPQEEELADAKRPDLRFHGMGFDGPVPVELKQADSWTGPALFERFETQLCGDYLRDRRSTRGVFLLVYRGRKGSWDLPDGSRAETFAALVQALEQRWLQLASQLANVEDVAVIGIDLTKRST